MQDTTTCVCTRNEKFVSDTWREKIKDFQDGSVLFTDCVDNLENPARPTWNDLPAIPTALSQNRRTVGVN